MTSVPHDRPLPNVAARLVLTPIRQGDAFRVPNNTDVWRNFRSEVVLDNASGYRPVVPHPRSPWHERLRQRRLGQPAVWRVVCRLFHRCSLAAVPPHTSLR